MSEKRFIFATNEKRFNLDDESRIWDNGTPMTALDIVVMLNELSEENEQLSKEHQEMLEKYVLLRLKIGEVLNDG